LGGGSCSTPKWILVAKRLMLGQPGRRQYEHRTKKHAAFLQLLHIANQLIEQFDTGSLKSIVSGYPICTNFKRTRYCKVICEQGSTIYGLQDAFRRNRAETIHGHQRRGAVIPSPIDQNPCAHWRNPMDMILQG
jgi:hypothetical protein